VLQAFLSEPTLDGLLRVASVLTLVDAVNWEKTAEGTMRRSGRWRWPTGSSSPSSTWWLVMRRRRKSDCALELGRMNPAAAIERADWSTAHVAQLLSSAGFDAADSRADPLPWLGLATYEAYASAAGDSTVDQDVPFHLQGKGIESFVLTRSEPLSRDELQFLLDGISQNLGPSLLRVKGLVNVREEPGRPAIIQGAQHLLHTMTWLDRWPSADMRTRVVFITQGIARDRLKDIIELLDRMSARTFAARERARLAREAEGQT
jgi:G3E family GTPase